MRICKDCERILDLNAFLRKDEELSLQYPSMREIVREVQDDVRHDWWEETLKHKNKICRRGFLRKCEWGRAQGIPLISRKRKSARLASQTE